MQSGQPRLHSRCAAARLAADGTAAYSTLLAKRRRLSNTTRHRTRSCTGTLTFLAQSTHESSPQLLLAARVHDQVRRIAPSTAPPTSPPPQHNSARLRHRSALQCRRRGLPSLAPNPGTAIGSGSSLTLAPIITCIDQCTGRYFSSPAPPMIPLCAGRSNGLLTTD